MKKIALFGATGSIGRSTLDVVGTIDGFRVLAISGHKNLPLLREQMERFRPRWVILTDEEAAKEWDFPVPAGTEICVGMKALTEIADELQEHASAHKTVESWQAAIEAHGGSFSWVNEN